MAIRSKTYVYLQSFINLKTIQIEIKTYENLTCINISLLPLSVEWITLFYRWRVKVQIVSSTIVIISDVFSQLHIAINLALLKCTWHAHCERGHAGNSWPIRHSINNSIYDLNMLKLIDMTLYGSSTNPMTLEALN